MCIKQFIIVIHVKGHYHLCVDCSFVWVEHCVRGGNIILRLFFRFHLAIRLVIGFVSVSQIAISDSNVLFKIQFNRHTVENARNSEL